MPIGAEGLGDWPGRELPVQVPERGGRTATENGAHPVAVRRTKPGDVRSRSDHYAVEAVVPDECTLGSHDPEGLRTAAVREDDLQALSSWEIDGVARVEDRPAGSRNFSCCHDDLQGQSTSRAR